MADPRISGASPINLQALEMLQKATEEELQQIESDQDLEQWCDMETFNPLAMMRRARTLDEFKEIPHEEHIEEQQAPEEQVMRIEKVEESAARFHGNNFELQAKTLLILRSRLRLGDTPEEILRKVLEIYSDPALADEAMDFLYATAPAGMAGDLRLAKKLLRDRYALEIRAGRNMGARAREFSKEGLGSPMSLRELYRNIVTIPREPIVLFDELSDKFPYDKLSTAINFLLHSMGSDLRSKGPTISRAELARLIDEIRSLQGILGVYRYFKSRMNLIQRQFNSYEMSLPGQLRFEILAKQLIHLVAERFISPEKILQAARLFGISEDVLAQIIIFTQMREGLKQISPRYYRNPKHRDELVQTFFKSLEKLEEELEEEQGEDTGKKRKKK